MRTKVLSIYLPQFHTIPENDKWWGKGFTEWTNVKRGRPFYPGHYQPREPLNDDYYDLTDLKVLEKHARLAKRAGIDGFCFYHYYFCGKKLLERPIESYRNHSKVEFPYCLIWANESWARRWYRAGSDNSILMQQEYGREKEWKEHFYYLLDFFKDERYIKVDNKPMFIIYIPQNIKYRRQMFALWDRMAKEHGFNGIYLIAMHTSFGKDEKNSLYDAFMDFEPLSLFWTDHSIRRKVQEWKTRHINFIKKDHRCYSNVIWTKNAFSYSYLCRRIEKKASRNQDSTLFGVFPGWDNTSRKDEEGIVVTGSSPKKFQKHLLNMLKLSESRNKEFIFINAWNEWSEGAYLEPDKRFGYGYLNAVKKAVSESGHL